MNSFNFPDALRKTRTNGAKGDEDGDDDDADSNNNYDTGDDNSPERRWPEDRMARLKRTTNGDEDQGEGECKNEGADDDQLSVE